MSTANLTLLFVVFGIAIGASTAAILYEVFDRPLRRKLVKLEGYSHRLTNDYLDLYQKHTEVLDEKALLEAIVNTLGDVPVDYVLASDEAVAAMAYCYTCFGLRHPDHFTDPSHRRTPAPEIH